MPIPKFFDCVTQSKHFFSNLCEDYFYLDNISNKLGFRKFSTIANKNNEIKEEKPLFKPTSWKVVALDIAKIVSYFSVIVPCVMLIGKAINRKVNHYNISPEEDSSTTDKTNKVGQSSLSPTQEPPTTPKTKDADKSPTDAQKPKEDEDSKNSNHIALNLKPIVEQNPTLPLAKTGGFTNGGNTCYLASIMQCLKVMPSFLSFLDEKNHPLQKKGAEEDGMLTTRNQIQRLLKELFQKSNSGVTVSGTEMDSLRLLLYKAKVVTSETGQDDTLLVWQNLAGILELPSMKLYDSDYEDYVYAPQYSCSPTKDINTVQAIINHENCIVSSVSHFPVVNMIKGQIKIDPESEIQVTTRDSKEISKYRLAGVTIHYGGNQGGHYLSYLYDHMTREWVQCNDSSVSKAKTIDDNLKKNIRMAFYEKIT